MYSYTVQSVQITPDCVRAIEKMELTIGHGSLASLRTRLCDMPTITNENYHQMVSFIGAQVCALIAEKIINDTDARPVQTESIHATG